MSNNLLNTNKYLSECDPKDVISFNNEQWASVSKFAENIRRAFLNSGISTMASYIAKNSEFKDTNYISNWFTQGQKCEILRAGSKGWQKGKLKINVTLEFIPDEPEENISPLDDIRQADNNSNL